MTPNASLSPGEPTNGVSRPRPRKRTSKIDVRVPPDLKSQITLAAALRRQTATSWIEAAVRRALADQASETE